MGRLLSGMQIANNLLSQWGPALLVCFTVIIGLFYQNTRLNDLKEAMNKRFEDMKNATDKRFDDLKDYLKSEFKRVDERIDRLESPFARK